MATRRQTFRLYPNKEQENKLFEARRNHAYLYNACVAHRRYEWKANKKSISYFDDSELFTCFQKRMGRVCLHAFTITASHCKAC